MDPALAGGFADAVQARGVGPLAQPAADKDAPEAVVGGVAGAEDLAVGARVELVDHLAVGGDDRLARVALEFGVVDELGFAHLLPPVTYDVHVVCLGG